jgi:hypothetical protein
LLPFPVQGTGNVSLFLSPPHFVLILSHYTKINPGYNFNNNNKKAVAGRGLVECPPSKCEALSSNSNTNVGAKGSTEE